MKSKCIFSCLLLILLSLAVKELAAQQSGYQLPPQAIVDIVDAKPTPFVSLSPDAEWMLMVDRDAMPDIADVSRRMLQLAGIRIDPASNGRFQTSYLRGITLRNRSADPSGIQNEETHFKIPMPENPKVSSISWSHNSKNFAFVLVTDKGQQLWVSSVETPKAPKMLTDRLNTVMGGFSWMPDGKSIVCRLVPEDRGAEPETSKVPTGPNIQESYGNKSPTRTYQDLLQNPTDEALFEHYTTTQLAIIGVDGKTKKMGDAQIISRAEPSPSGDYLLVSTIKKPFSYLLTYRSFPRSTQTWKVNDAASGPNVHTIVDRPMDENIPIEGVVTGPRRIDWKSGVPATLVWTEALDGGDPNKKAAHRDRFMTLDAPFDAEPAELFKVEHRAFGLSYFQDPSIVVSTEYDRDRRWIRTLLHDLKLPGTTPKVLMDRSIRDRYSDPGRIISVPDETGHVVARQDGDWIYRSGAGASAKGNLPFVDRQNIKTLEVQRLWRCEEGTFESPVRIVKSSDSTKPVVTTSSETPTLPPNFFLRDLNDDSIKPLTDFQDPTPQIRGIKKQLVKYERSDGVPLSATLYLPADYKEGTRLPLLVWAYPREFSDAKTAGQVSGTPSTFTRIRSISHLTMLTEGYAIMDAATMPVIGDPETVSYTHLTLPTNREV